MVLLALPWWGVDRGVKKFKERNLQDRNVHTQGLNGLFLTPPLDVNLLWRESHFEIDGGYLKFRGSQRGKLKMSLSHAKKLSQGT